MIKTKTILNTIKEKNIRPGEPIIIYMGKYLTKIGFYVGFEDGEVTICYALVNGEVYCGGVANWDVFKENNVTDIDRLNPSDDTCGCCR